MSNAELGAMCLSLMVVALIVIRYIWNEADEDIEDYWQNDWRKFK